MGFLDLLKQGLGITSAQKALQAVGQYAPRPVTDTLLATEQVMRNPPMLQLPRVQAPQFLPSTVRYMADMAINLPQTITEQAVNTPGLLMKGIANTGFDLAGQINHGERVPLTKYVQDIAPFAEGMLNIYTSGLGTGIAKSAIKNVAAPVAKQGIRSMLKSGAREAGKMALEGGLIGSGYGAVGGAQEPTDSTGQMIDNIIKQATTGAATGAIAGPVVGGTIKGVSKIIGKGKHLYDKMTPQERQAGFMGIPEKPKSMKEILAKKKLEQVKPEIPIASEYVHLVDSGLNPSTINDFAARRIPPYKIDEAIRNIKGSSVGTKKSIDARVTDTLKRMNGWAELPKAPRPKLPSIVDIASKPKDVTIVAPPEKPVQPIVEPQIQAQPKKTVSGMLKKEKTQEPVVVPAMQKGNRYLGPDDLAKENATVQKHFETWAAETRQAQTAGTKRAFRYVDTPESIKSDVIQAREKTVKNPSPEAKAIGGKLGETFDALYEVAKKHGLEVPFKEDFYTHIWDKESIDRMIRDKVMGRSVSGEPYFLKGQSITYAEGLARGYKPEYKTVAQDIQYYAQRLYKSIANKRLVERLKKDGVAFDYQAGSQYKPISINGYKNELDGSNVLYLNKKSADIAQKLFNPHVPTSFFTEFFQKKEPVGNALERTVATTAEAGKGATQVVLSGGFRNINAMGLGKLLFKEIPSGNFKAIKRFIQAIPKSGEEKIYQDISKDVMKYQGWGIDLHVGKNDVVDAISNKNITRSIPEKLVKLFKDNMESPTFDYFIPATQVDFARSIEAQARKQGLAEEAVREVVKKAMSNKYDIGSSLKTMLQNKNLHNLLDSIFFAKTLRKGTIQTNLINNIKALRRPLALENQGNMRGMVGGIVALSALNAINKASTGNNMWENPDGWNYAYIKYGENDKGEAKYFRLNTTSIEYTWLKQLLGIAEGAAKGDAKQVAQVGKQTLQFGLKTVVDLVTNTDWKMDKIWNPTDSVSDKLKKMGANTLNQNLHPVLKGIRTFFENPEDEQRFQKLMGEAAELPGTFKTEKQYKTATYYKNERDIVRRLTPEDQKAYEELKQKGTDFYSDQRDKVADAYLLLNNPEVMKAQRDIAIMTAEKNKQPLDPLWRLPDEQLKKYYQIQGLTNNSQAQKDMKKEEASWYDPLKAARTIFYDELNKSTGYQPKDSEYPQASTAVEQMKKEYYALPLGTGQRTRYANAHPELVAQWNKEKEYYDKVASSFGVPPAPPFGSGSGSSSYGKNSTYEKYRWSNLKAKNKAKIKASVSKMLKASKLKLPKYKVTKPKIKKTVRQRLKAALPKIPDYKAA